MLVIIKFVPVMWSWCCINTQFFVYDKSGSISRFINGKSRNLQKLPRHLSGIVTSTFKAGTAVWGGRSVSSQVFLVFLAVFVLFLFYIQMIYHLKHNHQQQQLHLYNNSINFLMSWNNFDYILTDYTSAWQYQDLLHYLSM